MVRRWLLIGYFPILKLPLESRPQGKQDLGLEVSAGWVSTSSRGKCGGDALCCSPPALLETETHRGARLGV
jgi:hypothetical protein